MTHLQHVVQNVPTMSYRRKVAGRWQRITADQYRKDQTDAVAEPNVVVRVSLPRGAATLAINVLETLVAGLQTDPEGGIAYLATLCDANRNARALIKPDTATPSARPSVAALPLDADPETIRATVAAFKAASLKASSAAQHAAPVQKTRPVKIGTTAIPATAK